MKMLIIIATKKEKKFEGSGMEESRYEALASYSGGYTKVGDKRNVSRVLVVWRSKFSKHKAYGKWDSLQSSFERTAQTLIIG